MKIHTFEDEEKKNKTWIENFFPTVKTNNKNKIPNSGCDDPNLFTCK